MDYHGSKDLVRPSLLGSRLSDLYVINTGVATNFEHFPQVYFVVFMMATTLEEPNFTTIWYIYYDVHVHVYSTVVCQDSPSNVVFSHMLFDLLPTSISIFYHRTYIFNYEHQNYNISHAVALE